LLLLSTCYIALFNPRQEGMSFLVVVPGLAALSLWFLVRNPADWRGWLWVALSVMVGIKWGAHQASWVLPATMVTIWIGLLALSLNPRRWSDLLSDELVWRFRSPHHSCRDSEMRTSEPKPL
jgi:uncharacterized membrane protein YfcA